MLYDASTIQQKGRTVEVQGEDGGGEFQSGKSKRGASPEEKKARAKESARRYYLKNREAVLIRTRIWALANKEKTQKSVRDYESRNHDSRLISKRERRRKNPEKARAACTSWRLRNLDREYELNRIKRLRSPEKYSLSNKLWIARNKDRKQATSKEWAKRNRRRIQERINERRKNDVEFSIMCRLRSRLYSAIKNGSSIKKSKTMELVGCDLKFLVSHIESQFKSGMTWNNRGEWEVDHKNPCASFNLADIQQQRICFHYTNLQPLWRTENRRKSSKIL